jgi:hypothetical protein
MRAEEEEEVEVIRVNRAGQMRGSTTTTAFNVTPCTTTPPHRGGVGGGGELLRAAGVTRRVARHVQLAQGV